MASADLIAQPPHYFDCLETGPQWIHASGSWISRCRDEQKPHDYAHLSTARRELPPVGSRPLLEERGLCERNRVGQAVALAVPGYGSRGDALHQGSRNLGVGEHG